MSSNREAQRSSARCRTNSRDDELAPAAVQMDVSNVSPLLQDLYQATRETKEQQVLDRLTHAKGLIEGGADLKATDPRDEPRCTGPCSAQATTPSRTCW